MESMVSLKGKRALITGGGTGIGRVIAECFLECGAQCVISGRREEPLKQACEEMGPNASYIVGDVADIKNTEAFVKKLLETGPIDILVNNAGVHCKKNFHDTTDEDFATLHATNLFGAVALTRAISRPMMERKSGSILNIVSMASIFGIPQVTAYTSAKSAMQGLTRAWATELSPHGITVNAIAPGFIETAMSKKAFDGDPARKQKVLSRTPMGRLGQPIEVGRAAAFMVSPAAAYITGVVLPVDGGTSIGF